MDAKYVFGANSWPSVVLLGVCLTVVSCMTVTFVAVEGHIETLDEVQADSLSLIVLSSFGWPGEFIEYYDSCVQTFSIDPHVMADSLHDQWAADSYLYRVSVPTAIYINHNNTFEYTDKYTDFPIMPVDRHSPAIFFIGYADGIVLNIDFVQCDIYE